MTKKEKNDLIDFQSRYIELLEKAIEEPSKLMLTWDYGNPIVFSQVKMLGLLKHELKIKKASLKRLLDRKTKG